MARVNAARDIFAAFPGIWTSSRAEEILAPKTACIPVQPSLPIVAISMILPSAYTANTEMTPLSGKNMWSSELSASKRNLLTLAANVLKLRDELLKIAGGQGEQKPIAGPIWYIVHALKPRANRVGSKTKRLVRSTSG